MFGSYQTSRVSWNFSHASRRPKKITKNAWKLFLFLAYEKLDENESRLVMIAAKCVDHRNKLLHNFYEYISPYPPSILSWLFKNKQKKTNENPTALHIATERYEKWDEQKMRDAQIHRWYLASKRKIKANRRKRNARSNKNSERKTK